MIGCEINEFSSPSVKFYQCEWQGRAERQTFTMNLDLVGLENSKQMQTVHNSLEISEIVSSTKGI